MADDTYFIDELATGGLTTTVTDDGSGTDWLILRGSYVFDTDIRLNYSRSIPSSDASGFFFVGSTNVGNRLIVNGLIENVRGSSTQDFIVGNEANNLIYGDQKGLSGGNDTLSGEDGNDTLYGGAAADTEDGGGGNDKLYGDSGNDTLNGASGRDTLEGGAGADSLAGGDEAGDTVSYAGSASGVRITITHGSVTTGIGGDAAGDQLGGFRNVIGSDSGDTITDTVSTTISFGYNNNAFFGGRGADRLVMGGGNDTAEGGTGDDTLSGGAGKDKLTGGVGADQLAGGSGADRFIFTAQGDSTAGAAGRDTISDFKHSQNDQIDLSALDANLNTPNGNEAFTFRTMAQGFSGHGAEVTYVAVSGGIKVVADMTADGVADFAILLTGVDGLVAGDFIL